MSVTIDAAPPASAARTRASRSSVDTPASPSPSGRTVVDSIVRLIPGWTRLPVGPESASRAVAVPA